MKKNYIITPLFVLFFFSFHANSQNLVWARQMGGTGNGIGNSLCLDASGNIYTTGYFSGTTDFDPGSGTFNLTSAGTDDIFISKLDPLGNFLWTKQIGGADYQRSFSIAVNANGEIYTTGFFYGTTDFDPGTGTYNMIASGATQDIFISKLDASGNFVWAKQMGDAGYEIGNSITLDISGDVYVTGKFSGTVDFDPGNGVFNMTSTVGSSDDDIFILKLDASGNFQFAKRMGGLDRDEGLSIAVDANKNIYTTGYFKAGTDFDPGAGNYYISIVDKTDIFVSKLDAAGDFVWAKAMAGTGDEQANAIFVDAVGNVYTTGLFERTVDFDPGAGTFDLTVDSVTDVFVSKLDASGNLVWAKKLGGSDDEAAFSIAVDAAGNVYTTGNFAGTADFDPGSGIYNLTATNYNDAFISKLDASGNFIWAEQIGGGPSQLANSIVTDAGGTVFITGNFNGTTDFDPGSGIYNVVSIGPLNNVYVVKLSAATGIIESDNYSENITFFPNPAANRLYINSEKQFQNIIIKDLTGRIIYKETVNKNSVDIDVHHFHEGEYFVNLLFDAGSETRRICIIRE
ncbi:MAG: SBBP repeat-containing protein [Bacteroidota bacterium]